MNTKSFHHQRIASLALAVVSLASSAQAAITVTFAEQGSDVILTYSGSWDTWNFQGVVGQENAVFGRGLANFSAEGADGGGNGGMTIQAGQWVSGIFSPSSFEGDSIGWNASLIYAPNNYVQGDPLSGSMTFNGTDLATMGLTAGDSGYFEGGGNRVDFSVQAVPEPSSLFLIGAAGLTGLIRRRRNGTKHIGESRRNS